MNLAQRASEWTESVRIASEQLMAHKVRSLLTALGVIIGIVAVTLMGTAIKGIDKGFSNSLDMLGQDIFYIEKWPWSDVGDDWFLYRNRRNIETAHADEINRWIRNNPESSLRIAVPSKIDFKNLKRKDRSISGVYINGTSADFGIINTANIESGRFFTHSEELSAQNVILLGHDVANTLFPEGTGQAIGDTVSISGFKYRVIGILERQGSFLGLQSFDRQVIIPLSSMLRFYTGDWRNNIRVQAAAGADMSVAFDELTGLYRRIRGLLPEDRNDFEVNRSEALEESLGPVKSGIAIAGFFITGLALFVGAIGIMNITFVSVKERTSEIGTRRAIGARRHAILLQFLIEAVSICLLGGIIGLAVAYGLKAAISSAFPSFPFTFSTDLVFMACALSIATGVLSGLAPAWQAARLDPANALRHE